MRQTVRNRQRQNRHRARQWREAEKVVLKIEIALIKRVDWAILAEWRGGEVGERRNRAITVPSPPSPPTPRGVKFRHEKRKTIPPLSFMTADPPNRRTAEPLNRLARKKNKTFHIRIGDVFARQGENCGQTVEDGSRKSAVGEAASAVRGK